jgi:acyl-CoA synthetase (AMP-forming)/AMP-acid ligase II
MYPGVHAATKPDKPAIVMGSGEAITYRELDERSARFAQLLHDRGVRTGDTVAIFAENHPRYFDVYWGAVRSGLYLTTVNRYLGPEEAAYIVNDSNARALVTTAMLTETATAMLAPDLILGCPTRLMTDGAAPGFEPYEAALADYPADPLPNQPRGDVMLYSSGTTGRPKGIRRPLPGVDVADPELSPMSRTEHALLGMDESSVYLCPAPLYHAAGLSWSAGANELGGTLVIMEKFDAEEFLKIIERERVTHTQVVPTMLVRVLKLPEETRTKYDLSSLVSVVHAAAPCPVEVKRRTIEWLGPIVDEYYAGTEGTGMTYINSADWLSHAGSVGRPVLGVPHISDEAGTELPIGETGIVYFEREAQPWQYHGDAEKTRDARHPRYDNWATLGDIGHLDEDGFLYLTDRRAFMIISGGVNIYPAEIENELVMHPKVADVAVFGLPDPEMGEYVHAVVQPAHDVEPSDELAIELRGYARERLASYKVPRVFDFRAELPRQPNGKLYKQTLRNEYLAILP